MKIRMNNRMNVGRLVALCLLVVFVAAGCGKGPYGDERSWPPGMGALPDRVGDAEMPGDEAVSFPSLWPNDQQLPAKLGYAMPTGTWFNGGANLGYGLTSGVQRPEHAFTVTLFGHGEDGVAVDRDVRIRLIARSPDLAAEQTLVEEIVHVGTVTGEQLLFSGTLPDDENALYSLGAEVLAGDGSVEDTLVALIYVPEAKLNVSLATDRDRYGAKDGEAKLVLSNAGPTVLMLGMGYTIEKEVEGQWRTVPLEAAFPGMALYLLPGQTHEETFDPSALDEGSYRIIKEVRADGFSDLSAVLAAPFQVSGK